MRPGVAALSFVAMCAGVALFYAASNSLLPGQLSFSEKRAVDFPLVNFLLTVIFMFIGVLFGSVHEHLSEMKEKERLSFQHVLQAVTTVRTAKAFLAAPIIYVGVYSIAQQQPDQVVSMLLAFQNGFFCNSIMREKTQIA